jgi:hypothetical protein
MGITPDLVRISVGRANVKDPIEDRQSALLEAWRSFHSIDYTFKAKALRVICPLSIEIIKTMLTFSIDFGYIRD